MTNKEHSVEHSSSVRPHRKIGVALSGGGARGFAHVGALLAIEEAGLKPDVLAGVSAGSVIAVLYAGGVRPLRIADIFARTGFSDFAELSLGSGGLFRIDKFMQFVLRALGNRRKLEELNIPTYIGVTNLDTGTPEVFSTGDIGPRMMASCSIPIVFRPIKIDGVHYVDGGVLRNHPAWIIRDKCDVLIGVNVSPMRSSGKYGSIVNVALRTYNLMAKANQAQDMELCDISIELPEIANYAVFDLKNIKTLVLAGYARTRKALRDAGLWHPDESKERGLFGQNKN